MGNLLVGISWIVALALLVLFGIGLVSLVITLWRMWHQGPVRIKWSVGRIRLKQP